MSFVQTLQVLGLMLSFVPRTMEAAVTVDPAKAAKWTKLLGSILASKCCTQRLAIKMVGRLSFAVMASTGRVGRAYIKPFFAQANAPLPRSRASWQMIQAAEWWIGYFALSAVSIISCGGTDRRVVRAWTDAAGASRWLAAVLHTEVGFFWTRALLPQLIWDQFLPREDEQIGGQELMAIPLMAATFRDLIEGALIIIAVDNSGVVGNLIRGSGSAADHNAAIARIWLDFAAEAVGPYVIKVETKCNVADGPTRDFFGDMIRLNAQWIEPRWPDWIQDIWRLPR